MTALFRCCEFYLQFALSLCSTVHHWVQQKQLKRNNSERIDWSKEHRETVRLSSVIPRARFTPLKFLVDTWVQGASHRVDWPLVLSKWTTRMEESGERKDGTRGRDYTFPLARERSMSSYRDVSVSIGIKGLSRTNCFSIGLLRLSLSLHQRTDVNRSRDTS